MKGCNPVEWRWLLNVTVVIHQKRKCWTTFLRMARLQSTYGIWCLWHWVFLACILGLGGTELRYEWFVRKKAPKWVFKLVFYQAFSHGACLDNSARLEWKRSKRMQWLFGCPFGYGWANWFNDMDDKKLALIDQ